MAEIMVSHMAVLINTISIQFGGFTGEMPLEVRGLIEKSVITWITDRDLMAVCDKLTTA